MLGAVTEVLCRELFNDKSRTVWVERVRERLQALANINPEDVAKVRRDVGVLDRQIEIAARRYSTEEDEDLRPELGKDLKRLKGERSVLAERLKGMEESAVNPRDIESTVQAVARRLEDFDIVLRVGKRNLAAKQRLFRSVLGKIVVNFRDLLMTPRKRGAKLIDRQRHRIEVTSIEVTVRSDAFALRNLLPDLITLGTPSGRAAN